MKTVATVGEARQWVGEAIGQTNVEEQYKILNRVRQWVYSNRLDLGVETAFPFVVNVERFYENNRAYMGFRLPPSFDGLQAIKINDMPVASYSQWRTPYDGVSGRNAEGVAIFDRGDKGLQRDLEQAGPVEFVSQETTKASQEIVIKGQLTSGELKEVSYQCTKDAQFSMEIWSNIIGVSVPEGADGIISVRDEEGRELVRIDGGRKYPQFRSYEVTGCVGAASIVVQANRRYEDLKDDRELVEFGGDLLWNLLAKAVDLIRMPDLSDNDRRNLDLYQSQAVSLMQQSAGSEAGESMLSKFQRKKVRSAGLYSQRRAL